jgi:hypothetical protein
MVEQERQSNINIEGPLFLREYADRIVNSSEVLDRSINPEDLPIPGLRKFTFRENGQDITVYPREILHEDYCPVVIVDLDETIWPHAKAYVTTMSFASGVHATTQDLIEHGFSTNIPELKEPWVTVIHNQIQRNEHPLVNPFINVAYQPAVEIMHTLHKMGITYSYFTSRSLQHLYGVTHRGLEWNGLPLDKDAKAVNPQTHREPKNGYLYCSPAGSVCEYKKAVLKEWIKNKREAKWKGRMILIDDTPKGLKTEIEAGEITSISLKGLLNVKLDPQTNEYRVGSWDEIGEILVAYHQEAVEKSPGALRVFDLGPEAHGARLYIRKDAAGTGYFKIEDINPLDYYLDPKSSSESDCS